MDGQILFTAGYSIHKKDFSRNKVLTSYLLRLQGEGSCEVELNGVYYDLKPGDLLYGKPGDTYFLNIGSEHTHKPVRSGDYYLNINETWLSNWWTDDDIPQQVYLGLDEQILHIWKTIIYEKRKLIDADENIQDYLFRLLFLSIKRLIKNHAASREKSYTPYKMKNYIENNANRKFTLNDVAEHVGLGISRASELFKETFRCSVMNYALEVRLNMAKDQIVYDNISLEEIAYSCGFQTYSHFSRAFHSKFGRSPREFKLANRVK